MNNLISILSTCSNHRFRTRPQRQHNLRYNMTAVSADYMFTINHTQCYTKSHLYASRISLVDQMFALNGSLLAYFEQCDKQIVIYANKPDKYGGILANFTRPRQFAVHTNFALTPSGHIMVQASNTPNAANYMYAADEENTKILTYSGDKKFEINNTLLMHLGRFGSTVDDDIVMCNTNNDIVKLTWSDGHPLWSTLFLGAQRSPWLCKRAQEVYLQEGGTAWWILENGEEIDIYGNKLRLAIYKQRADSAGVISLHSIVRMRTPDHRPIMMNELRLAYDGDLSVFVTERKDTEYIDPVDSAIIIHVFTTSGRYERELIRSRVGHELVSTHIAVDRRHKLLYTGHKKLDIKVYAICYHSK